MNSKPKILLVYIEPTPYIVGLIKAIEQKLLYQLDIVFLDKNKSQNWNISQRANWVSLPKNIFCRIKFIVSIFLNNKYDVLHIAGWGELNCKIFIMLAKLFRVPVVVESDTPLPFNNQYWKKIIKRTFYPLMFSLVNMFMPGGTRQSKYLEHYGVMLSRILKVNMTVDVTNIKNFRASLDLNTRLKIRNQYHITQDNIVFLYVGRLEPHKGIIDLITIFNNHQIKNSNLLIVGDGSLKNYVEINAKSNNKIKYVGRLTDQELLLAYYAADIFILPSYFEPWGLVVNEAMAMSLPIIVSDRVGCIDDLISYQKNGLIYQAGNLSDLQSKIEYFLNNPKMIDEMGKKSAEIINHWTLENEAKSICQGWNSLVNP